MKTIPHRPSSFRTILSALAPSYLALTLALPGTAFAQRQELGLTLCGIVSQDRGFAKLSGGTALQANYGYRVWGNDKIAILVEVPFLANGQRKISSADQRATADVATLYVTPGIRIKFKPDSRIAPYVTVGGGYALYEQSLFQLSGATNPAPRYRNGGTFAYGAGVDVRIFSLNSKLWRYGLRGEIRDFYSGNPDFNLGAIAGRQHNVVIGGGFTIKFGSRQFKL